MEETLKLRDIRLYFLLLLELSFIPFQAIYLARGISENLVGGFSEISKFFKGILVSFGLRNFLVIFPQGKCGLSLRVLHRFLSGPDPPNKILQFWGRLITAPSVSRQLDDHLEMILEAFTLRAIEGYARNPCLGSSHPFLSSLHLLLHSLFGSSYPEPAIIVF